MQTYTYKTHKADTPYKVINIIFLFTVTILNYSLKKHVKKGLTYVNPNIKYF